MWSKTEARRIVACVNACDGLDTELLENITTMGDTLASRFKMRDQVERELKAQRDELLAALRLIADNSIEGGLFNVVATAAIAKVEGGDA